MIQVYQSYLLCLWQKFSHASWFYLFIYFRNHWNHVWNSNQRMLDLLVRNLRNLVPSGLKFFCTVFRSRVSCIYAFVNSEKKSFNGVRYSKVQHMLLILADGNFSFMARYFQLDIQKKIFRIFSIFTKTSNTERKVAYLLHQIFFQGN